MISINVASASECRGEFVNPFTDVCWKCLFPISVGPAKVGKGKSKLPDTENPKKPICFCKGKIPPIGIPVGFWEPVRIAEVTRTPYCLMSIGGVKIADNPKKQGTVGHQSGRHSDKRSYYHAHWYIYPPMYLLELLTDFLCMEKNSIDVTYLTEFDPLWNDDAKAMILNPEAILFGNMLTQAVCGIDCIKATVGLPHDKLFWCAGCQGSMYPFTGTINTHYSGVQASQLVIQKMMAKLHRQLLMWRTSGKKDKEICDKGLAPIIKKSQYRIQMTYPKVDNTCYPLGRTTVKSESGVEKPYSGEDFAYMIWRKVNCCLSVPIKK